MLDNLKLEQQASSGHLFYTTRLSQFTVSVCAIRDLRNESSSALLTTMCSDLNTIEC